MCVREDTTETIAFDRLRPFSTFVLRSSPTDSSGAGDIDKFNVLFRTVVKVRLADMVYEDTG